MPEEHPAVARVNALLEAASGELRALDTKTNRSLGFYFGEGQWKLWDGPIPWAPQPFEGERRLVINKWAESFDRRHAKLVAATPIWTVVPATGEVQDLRSAKLCERGIEWGWYVADGEEKYAQWLWWGGMGPRSWLKVAWLTDARRRQTRPMMDRDLVSGLPTGAPVMGPDGQPMMQEVYEGLPGLVVRSHYQMVWDPLATWEGDARWCIEVNLESCDEVKRRYGVRPEPDGADPGDRFWRRRFLEQLRAGTTNTSYSGGPEEEVCEVREEWKVPCEQYPDGRRTVVTRSTILHEDKHPYEDKLLPYVGFSERRVGSSLYGETVGWRLFDPQQEVNIHHSSIREHCDTASNPMLRYERSQNVAITELEGGRSGKALAYDSTGAPMPDFAAPGQLSPDIWRYGDMVERDLAELGEIPYLAAKATGETSGKALIERIEEDDSVIGPTRMAVATALKRAGKMMLSRFKQFMPAPRIIRVVGKDHTIAVHKFSAEDVRPDFDVLVDLEAGTRTSKAVKTKVIMDLLPMAIQADPDLAMELARSLPVGGLERVLQRASIHVSFAERQIERVSMTKRAEPVRPGEKVDRSIKVWDPFLLSEDFEMLDEQAKAALLQTYQEKVMAQQQQQAAAAAAMAAQAQTMATVKGTQAAASGRPKPRGAGSAPADGGGEGEVF